MIIKLILAIDNSGCIGKNQSLPWKLKDDLKHFKEVTLNSPIVMGANTYKSLPGILPDREHIVISNSLCGNEDISVFTSIKEALDYLKEIKTETVYLIGGSNLVKQFHELKLIDEYILTHVDDTCIDGDTFIDTDTDLEIYKWNFYRELKHEKDERNSHSFKIRYYKKEVKRFY